MRALGLDLGSKRIGVAVSDRSGTIATPLVVITRAKRRDDDHARIAALVVEEEAECIVVGLPLNMDGSAGSAAKGAVAEAGRLASVVGVPVVTWDERRSTVTAAAILRESGVNSRDGRSVVDKVAAAVLLQGWLDHRREQLSNAGGDV
jgi:putative holliday junction resolvase